jgi:hypothetical protein
MPGGKDQNRAGANDHDTRCLAGARRGCGVGKIPRANRCRTSARVLCRHVCATSCPQHRLRHPLPLNPGAAMRSAMAMCVRLILASASIAVRVRPAPVEADEFRARQ